MTVPDLLAVTLFSTPSSIMTWSTITNRSLHCPRPVCISRDLQVGQDKTRDYICSSQPG